MPRSLSMALIASLCLAFTVRAEDKPSPGVKRILDKAVAKVRANRTEFDKANKKPLDEARAELQDLSTKLIKDGKTEEAKAVLGQVGTLEADVMRQANAPPPVAGGAGPQKPLLERLAGRWGHPNAPHLFEFSQDGKAKHVNKSGELVSEGTLRPISDDEVEIRWSNHWGSRYRVIDSDEIVERAYSPDGKEHGEGGVRLRIK